MSDLTVVQALLAVPIRQSLSEVIEMPRKSTKPLTSARIGTDDAAETPVPIRSTGIGTRVGHLSDLIGTRAKAAIAGGISAATLQRYIRDENTPPLDVAARLCAAANVRLEWLATGSEPMTNENVSAVTHSQSLRLGDLKIALQLVGEALENKHLPTEKHAELVALIYELLEDGLPQAQIIRLARVASS